MTVDDILTIFTGAFGVFLLIIITIYVILTFLLPIFVYMILRKLTRANEYAAEAANKLAYANRAGAEQAKHLTYQVELAVAALQRIKENSDQTLQHAAYHTEVEKHRLALDAMPALGTGE